MSDTLAAVLKNAPDWTRLPSSVPAPVRHLIEHCLERDPRTRLRDIADAGLLLDSSPPQPGHLSAPAHAPWIAAAGGALLTAAVFAAAWMALGPEPSAQGEPVRRVTVSLPVNLPTSTSGGGPALTITRDGSAIAFTGRTAGQNQLYVHRLADATTAAVRGPANPNSPVFSPDGAWVAYGGPALERGDGRCQRRAGRSRRPFTARLRSVSKTRSRWA